MSERLLFIVDASIVGRWYLRNEPFVEAALRIQDDYLNQRIALLAPDNLRYEVAGAIRQAVNQRQIRASDGEHYIRRVLQWDIPLVDGEELILPAYQLSIRLGCSFYDAIYLTLGESRGIPVVHADRRLHTALAGRFPLETWIEDYGTSLHLS